MQAITCKRKILIYWGHLLNKYISFCSSKGWTVGFQSWILFLKIVISLIYDTLNKYGEREASNDLDDKLTSIQHLQTHLSFAGKIVLAQKIKIVYLVFTI